MEAVGKPGKNVPLLSVRGIYKSFGLNALLKGIDLDSLALEQVIKQALKKMVKG